MVKSIIICLKSQLGHYPPTCHNVSYFGYPQPVLLINERPLKSSTIYKFDDDDIDDDNGDVDDDDDDRPSK